MSKFHRPSHANFCALEGEKLGILLRDIQRIVDWKSDVEGFAVVLANGDGQRFLGYVPKGKWFVNTLDTGWVRWG